MNATAALADRDELAPRLANAASLLPPLARERVRLLHGWWRECTAMLNSSGSEEITARLVQVRRLTARAIAGEMTDTQGFDALAVMAAVCDFATAQTDDVITGLALHGVGWRPASQAELLGYAYHAGGAPGVLVMRAMGIAADDGEMLDCACAGGVALVLGRLADDLVSGVVDAARMLPGDWLVQNVGADQLMLPAHRGLRIVFAARLRRLAAPYAISARYGAAHLPFRCRWAAATLLVRLLPGVRGKTVERIGGLIQALRHGPDEAGTPLARAALARLITPIIWARPADAGDETAVPAR